MTGIVRARRGRGWLAELAGWAFAAAVSVGVVARVATVSTDLLFTDGDSLIVPLVIGSLAVGQPQDWAMSPVLFLPELSAYALLSLLGGGLRTTILLAGVLNLLALYGALRLVAGRRGAGRAPVAGAVIAFAVVAMLALLEGTARRDGAAFVSLFTTTAYYAATVVALLLVIGLSRRALDGAAVVPAIAIALISAVSVVSNPLFAVWALTSLGIALLVVGVWRHRWRVPGVLLAALVLGSAVGYAARGMFGGAIVAQSDNYLRVGQWSRAAEAYGRVLADTTATVPGTIGLLLLAGMWAGSVALAAAAARGRDAPVFLVAATAALGPVVLTVGAFAFGTDAPRYLQPWLFLPLAALACVPSLWPGLRRASSRAVSVVVAAVAGIAAVVALVIGAPAAVAAASGSDRDLSCVVSWVDASGRTGAGQFWTVRAPKANLADPARLVQVDHTLRPYQWLTNRADARDAEVTFLVVDAQSPAFVLPAGASPADAREIGCGRYTILDFGERHLPLGAPRN